MRFCPRCGEGLNESDVGGRPRPACRGCGYVHFGQWFVGVGGIVVRADRVLLARRAIPPSSGSWAIPGGYVECDETLEQAVLREIHEETGVTAKVRSVASVRSLVRESHHDTYVAFALEWVAGEGVADGQENSDVGWFTEDGLADLPGLTVASQTLIGKILKGGEGLPAVEYRRDDGALADCFAVNGED